MTADAGSERVANQATATTPGFFFCLSYWLASDFAAAYGAPTRMVSVPQYNMRQDVALSTHPSLYLSLSLRTGFAFAVHLPFLEHQ